MTLLFIENKYEQTKLLLESFENCSFLKYALNIIKINSTIYIYIMVPYLCNNISSVGTTLFVYHTYFDWQNAMFNIVQQTHYNLLIKHYIFAVFIFSSAITNID